MGDNNGKFKLYPNNDLNFRINNMINTYYNMFVRGYLFDIKGP